MPTSLYLNNHQPAKWARLTRSSICSILLDIGNGCQHSQNNLKSPKNAFFVDFSNDVVEVLGTDDYDTAEICCLIRISANQTLVQKIKDGQDSGSMLILMR